MGSQKNEPNLNASEPAVLVEMLRQAGNKDEALFYSAIKDVREAIGVRVKYMAGQIIGNEEALKRAVENDWEMDKSYSEIRLEECKRVLENLETILQAIDAGEDVLYQINPADRGSGFVIPASYENNHMNFWYGAMDDSRETYLGQQVG